jgi:hypothetical protein
VARHVVGDEADDLVSIPPGTASTAARTAASSCAASIPAARRRGSSTSSRERPTGWKACAPVARSRSMIPFPGTPASASSRSSTHAPKLV